MIQKLNVEKIVLNPANPRIIKNDRFKKLVKSIREFPEMLDLRPIVVNSDFMILGGNMRFKAAKEAGLTQVPVLIAEQLSDDQQKEFIIKDNLGFGEWDWEILQDDTNWIEQDLEEWGLDLEFKTETDYIPNLNPIFDTSEVTKEQVNKIARELVEQMNRNKTLEDVICPHCGNEFSLE